MKLKKIIISFFLLFVYSISFAHSLTFHEHGFYAEHQYEFSESIEASHSHEYQYHHTHTLDKEKVSTNHIQHNDHCDEGVLDLISCVLADLPAHNHNHTDCEFDEYNSSEAKRLSNKNTVHPVLVFYSACDFINTASLKSINRLIKGKDYTLVKSIPLRGPPNFC